MPRQKSEFRERIIELHEKGYSTKEIAAIARCALSTVWAYKPKQEKPPIDQPTPAEIETLILVAQGLSNSEIGKRRFCSTRTIESHVSNLLMKSGTNNRLLLSIWGIEKGYCPPRQAHW